MNQKRKAFYFLLKIATGTIINFSPEADFALNTQEQEIFYEGVLKLRSLEAKLEKEYEKESNDAEKK